MIDIFYNDEFALQMMNFVAKAAKDELRKMIVDGSLKPWVNEFQGLEKGPEAFVDMLAGGNVGTTTVRVSA